MKLIHLSDLHLGKRVNDFSLLDDQRFILKRMLNIIDLEKADVVMIAGDVYDKSVPSAEAVELFDDFLVSLSQRGLQVFVISGNHDSPERLSFGRRLMDGSGIHIAPVYNGVIEPIPLSDEYGRVNIYMLPFVKSLNVRAVFKDETISSYTEAVRACLERLSLAADERNLLITHQFVTGADRSDSEDISVGGTDNVDASVFDGFDYVALGHIHGPQNIGSPRIRYCGTPLKYSFSEAGHQKSVTVVELYEKGRMKVRTVPLIALRDMAELRGSYNELTLKSFYDGTSYPTDYVHITLTDEDDVPEALSKLRVIYRNIMKLDYDNKRTRHSTQLSAVADVKSRSPLELFSDFFEQQNNMPMSDVQRDFVCGLINRIWEEDE